MMPLDEDWFILWWGYECVYSTKFYYNLSNSSKNISVKHTCHPHGGTCGKLREGSSTNVCKAFDLLLATEKDLKVH